MSDDLGESQPAPASSSNDSLHFFEGISWTPQIEEAVHTVVLWINTDMCGAALWGLPRVGKSEFAKYFERTAAEMFGTRLVVVRLMFGGQQFHKPEEFLKRALKSLGVRATSTRDLETLRTRLLDEIFSRCTPETRRIVVIADELQNIAPALYGEFAILETQISEKTYIPFLLCIGQPELQSTVANVETNLHIIGRQFQELREFRGLSFDQIEVFLHALDGEGLKFSKRHFPTRAAQGWSIVQLVGPLKQAVHSVFDLPKMSLELFFPMAYLRQTLNYVFFFLLDDANADQEVTMETVLEAFDRNGFRKLIMRYVKPKEIVEVNADAES